MRGGEVFMEALMLHGVERIFGNPGTTENTVLDRLVEYPALNYYVALHESVAVCAASFYAQASGRTGVVNLHVAPGLGNGIGMLYGALKAQSPMVVTAGQQDTRMLLANPVLSHDLVAMAAPVTKFSAEPRSANEIGPLLRRAFQIAHEPPAGPVFIALPVNVMEQETTVAASTSGARGLPHADAATIAEACDLIRASRRPCLVIGDDPIRAGAFDTLIALAETIGAPVFHEGLRAQLSFPNRHVNYRGRVPFEPGLVQRLLQPYDLAILVGGPFFEDIWYDEVCAIPAATRVLQFEESPGRLAFNFPVALGVAGGLKDALARVQSSLSAMDPAFQADARARQGDIAQEAQTLAGGIAAEIARARDTQPLTALHAFAEIAAAIDAATIVVDETITGYGDVAKAFTFKRAGDWFSGRGGGIGQGIAGALGIQLACPSRPVLALSGDGSAMYSIQALWTAAHHGLPIVFVIVANREYRVLKHNLDTYRRRFDVRVDKPYPHMDLARPALDFAALAAGMGVAGERITDAAAIGPAVRRAQAAGEPRLIEIVVAGKDQGNTG